MSVVRLHRSRIGLAVAATFATAAIAQSPAPATPPTQKVEKIEVTGSNIKRVDAETSSPVTVITAEEIKRTGSTSVQELLNNLSISSGSALSDVDGGSGFSPGSATVALRGLGSAATLTLINGRRISPAAFNDPNVGSTVITNLNSIPAAAIERIEILRDGASAIYGSDAIAGVVNIILRKDFKGAIGSATVSESPGMDFLVKQASVTFGVGDLAKDRYNFFGTYERFERDPTLINAADNVSKLLENPTFLQRRTVLSSLSFPGNYYREAVRGSGIFGTFQAARAGCPAELVIGGLCRYNQWDDLEQVGKTRRDTAFGRATVEFTPALSGFAEASFSRTESTFTGAPPSSNPQAATFWRGPTGELLRFQLVLPVGHRENPFAFPIGLRYRWVDMGRVRDISTTEDKRILAGLKGSLGTWDLESSVVHNTSTANTNSGRRFVFPAIQTAVNDGSYNFGGGNSQAVIDRISAYTVSKGKGSASIWDAKASGELGSLPAGPIAVAVGAEYRRDSISINPDPQIAAGNIVGLGASFADGSRNVSSAYAETVLPISRFVEATMAARYDRYSDFGSSTNPKFGIKWKPLKDLVIRSSYSTGFRAPTLSQTSRSSIRSFQAVNDPIRCPVTNTDDDCGRRASISAQIVFNPNIEAETSSSRNVGLVWDVTRDFNLSMDYFDIRRENEIDRFSSNFQVNALFNGDQRFAPFVFRDPNPLTWIPGVPNSGPVIGVDRAWLNLGKTQITGIDVDMAHRLSLGERGNISSTASLTYNLSAKASREKGDPLVDNIGGVNSVNGNGLPRFRSVLAINWSKGDWNFGARSNYIRGWNNSNRLSDCAAWNGAAVAAAIPEVCSVKSWHTIDLNATYSGIKDLTVRVVIRNVTDEAPPFDFSGGSIPLGYNTQFHNPLGIYPSLSVTYRFK